MKTQNTLHTPYVTLCAHCHWCAFTDLYHNIPLPYHTMLLELLGVVICHTFVIGLSGGGRGAVSTTFITRRRLIYVYIYK